MLQSFDRSVPISTQRYLVAIKKCVRKKGKRHRTSPERLAKVAKQRGAKKAVAYKLAQQRKQSIVNRAFWAGEWLG